MRAYTKRLVVALTSICLVTIVIGSTDSRAQDLPVSARADLLQRQIVGAIKAKHLAEALRLIDAYKALKVPVPPAIYLVEAKVAKQTGHDVRAFQATTNYLKTATRREPGYDNALALYTELERKSDVRRWRATLSTTTPTQAPAEPGPADPSGNGRWVKDSSSGCEVWSPIPLPDESVSWSGRCADGRANGTGQVTWFSDGHVQETDEGTLHNGAENGIIRTTDKDGNYYESNEIDGIVNGSMKTRSALGNTCEGYGRFEFENGTWHIQAQMNCHYADGTAYIGGLLDWKPDGSGTATAPGGFSYVGGFLNGKHNGSGTLNMRDGSTFTGEFADDIGINGILRLPDGRTCNGHGVQNAQGNVTYSCTGPTSMTTR